MRQFLRWLILISILITGILFLVIPLKDTQAQIEGSSVLVVGTVLDTQNQAVAAVQVNLNNPGADKAIAEAITQPDGSYLLPVTGQIPPALSLEFERAHFKNTTVQLDASQLKQLQAGETVTMPEVKLERHINPAFWISTGIFVLVLALIATGVVHNTLAALLGTALIFAFSYLGSAVRADFFIFTFRDALGYVDWNVIFLIMGMMIVIAAVERTGIFQWLAFFAYRISGGRTWLLVAILMLATGIASAFLDNVTTMLLMTPMTIQIAMALGINPLALLMPEVFASNVVGISTLVGTPTNILIGSYAAISFNDFLKNLTPGVLLALLGLIIYSEWIYRKELQTVSEVSPELLERLEEHARITQPDHLKKAGWVGAGMLILFVTGEHFQLLPSVTALIGATALLLWIRPDIEEMIESVDWTTLVFFITLFIVVGSIQEVGLISMIATLIGRVFGQNLVLTVLAIIWLSAILSTVVANIPFTAAMLPVISFLTASMPAASSKVLYYSLSIGSAMGGNGSLSAPAIRLHTVTF
jgi:Na+/H+ antiporter NhaD/arsenite permease-like protein